MQYMPIFKIISSAQSADVGINLHY